MKTALAFLALLAIGAHIGLTKMHRIACANDATAYKECSE